MPTFPTQSSGSMKVHGALLNDAMAQYPSSIANEYVVRTFTFLGDQEQRFLVRNGLFRCMLQYAGMNGYDTSIIRRFFYSMKGAAVSPDLSNTFSIVLGGVTYPGCVFDQDDFTVEMDQSERASFQLKIKQIVPVGPPEVG